MNTASPRKWTVMVYMAADNNLSDRCVDDLREMKMVGMDDNITIKVQVDRASGLGNEPARYTIHGVPLEGSSDPKGALKKDREEWSRHYNTGRKEPLLDFIEWCAQDHTDDQFMLVLWGHASPLDNVPIPEPRQRKFRAGSRSRRQRAENRVDAFFNLCPDDFSQDGLTDLELRDVLSKVCVPGGAIGKPIEILGLDACLMSMVELSYQFKDYVQYIIASQSLVPSTSWPYHWILASLNRKPTMGPRELCHVIVEKYIAYYADYDDIPVQLSACDLSLADRVKDAVGSLAARLIASLEAGDLGLINAVLSAHFRAQSYDEDQYYDLYDFCYMLRESCGDKYEDIRKDCELVMFEVAGDKRKSFIIDSENNVEESSDTDLQFSYGTSIYLPWLEVSPRYEKTDFATRSNWITFLKLYIDSIAKFDRKSRSAIPPPEPKKSDEVEALAHPA